MSIDNLTNISEHELPYGRKLDLKNLDHESGLQMLRLTFREGKRITIIDLDSDSAKILGDNLINWANKNS
jgi:hypothetical protein